MRISTEALPKHLEPALTWIGGLIGAALDKRVAGFEQQEKANPLLGAHFRENYPLEFALAKARRFRKTTGHIPKGEEYHRLYSFLIPAHRIHSALPMAAKAPFEGRLRQALSSTDGARPFAYEITIATHLMQKGWDVEFVDYLGSARFDLLARQGATEVEVECKTTSGDTGRKIHRQEVNRLADLLLPLAQRLADEAGCHRLLITVPDRLSRSLQDLSGIATIASSAAHQRNSAPSDLAQVDYIFDGAGSWPEPDDPNILPFFERRFGVQNANVMFLGRPHTSIVAIMIRSARPDTVVKSIAEEAKAAADQCSGNRPALIALHLIDQISRSNLQAMLKTSNDLHLITHEVFKSGKRQHVDSLAFTVPPVARTDAFGGRRLSGDLVMLNNPEPRFPCEKLRSIFRPS
jgi:hypothetical protein